MFFDNLQVVHTRGALLEENSYYPFGLTMAGISSKAMSFGGPENKKKFNGIEHTTDFDLNTYEAFYRSLDAQIGRWWQIDPKPSQAISPYAAMNNNPLLLSDPLGDTTWVYDRNGHFLGVVNDKLKNQVHFMGSVANDKAAPFDASKLSKKDAKALGKAFRSNSIAFMGSKTASDMQKITNQAVANKTEIGFVGTIGKDKEIRLTALPIDGSNKLGELALENQINKAFPSASEQSSLFLSGHTHIAGYLAGFTGGDGSAMGSQTTFGAPTNPDDYANNLYRNNNDSEKGRSPLLLITPWGVTTYGSQQIENRSTNNSYILYQSLKR